MTPDEHYSRLDLNGLIELMNALKNQTPSSAPWYQGIHQVVGTLLAIEIEKREKLLLSLRTDDE